MTEPIADVVRSPGPASRVVAFGDGKSQRNHLSQLCHWFLRYLQHIFQTRPFLVQVSVTLGGVAAGQAATLLLSPVLARIYTPHEFGTLGVYSAMLTILIVVGSLRYELAITLTETAEAGANLAAVCCAVLVAMTGLLAIAAPLIPQSLLAASGLARLPYWRILLPAGFVMLTLYSIALFLAVRERAHGSIARARALQGVVGPLSQIAMGLAGFGAIGLVAGFILSQSTGTVGLVRAAFRDRWHVLRALSLASMLDLTWRYRRFPLIASWAALFDAAGSQLLYFLTAVCFGATAAGYIFLAERVVARPMIMLGSAILQVFVGEVASLVRTDTRMLRRRFHQIIRCQCAIALGWVLAINVAATWLFVPLFGEQWADGLTLVRALSVAYFATAILQPVAHTLQLLERQGLAAIWQASRLIVVLSVFLAGVHLGGSVSQVILGYALAQALASAALLLLMAHAIRLHDNQITKGDPGITHGSLYDR